LVLYVVNMGNQTDLLYTHFSYFPIVLAALWFAGPGSTVGMAISLGALHIYSNYILLGAILLTSVYRALFLILVGYIVSLVSLHNRRQIEMIIREGEKSQPIDSDIGKVVADLDQQLRRSMSVVKEYIQYLQKEKSLSTYHHIFAKMLEEVDKTPFTATQDRKSN
jgi:hypothetical protein